MFEYGSARLRLFTDRCYSGTHVPQATDFTFQNLVSKLPFIKAAQLHLGPDKQLHQKTLLFLVGIELMSVQADELSFLKVLLMLFGLT